MGIERCFIIPQRVILAIMGFFAVVNAYTMRICLSVTLTDLVVRKNYTNTNAVCAPEEGTLIIELRDEDRYPWSEEVQGRILSAFFCGYVLTHIPAGILADKYGGKWPLSLGILSTAIFTIITPYAIVNGGINGLVAVRIAMGLAEGTTFPSVNCLCAKWLPPGERGTLGALVMGGVSIGTILGNSLSGLLVRHYGWTSVFYCWGAVAIVWFILFILLCYSDPRTHPFISKKELEYLAIELAHTSETEVKHPIPWVAILTNPAVFAAIISQVGHDWGFYIMTIVLPKYMADIMRFSITKNGFTSALPFAFMWILTISAGFLADCLKKRKILTTTNTRKLMTALGAIPPGFFMVGASYAGCNETVVVVCFCSCMAFMGCWYAGTKLSPLDMSKNYSGILMAITNAVGATSGFIAPYSMGLLTPNATLLEWRLVFYLAFVVLNVSAIIYCLYASAEIQPFDDPETLKAYEEEMLARGPRTLLI